MTAKAAKASTEVIVISHFRHVLMSIMYCRVKIKNDIYFNNKSNYEVSHKCSSFIFPICISEMGT